MLDRKTFARIMRVFADRIGRGLEADTQAMYYATLGEELDTETFQRAAVLVFKTHGYNTWPAPGAFLDAAKLVRHERDAEIKQTQKLLAAYSEIPAPRDEAVEEFGRLWRQHLADCDPSRPRRPAPRTGDDGAWLTDETRPVPAPDDAVRAEQDADADREVA
jgi:hypothetical protein